MEVSHSLLDLVGDTPLVRLDRVGRIDLHLLPSSSSSIRWKCQGSSRLGHGRGRRRDGHLKPVDHREPTSGNRGWVWPSGGPQGIPLCCSSCPTRSPRRRSICCALTDRGVSVHHRGPGTPDSYYSVSDRLAREIPAPSKPISMEIPKTRPPTKLRRAPRYAPDRRSGHALRSGIATVDDHRRGRYLKSQNQECRSWEPIRKFVYRGGVEALSVEGTGRLLARHVRSLRCRHRGHGE